MRFRFPGLADRLGARKRREPERGWPGYLLGGHIRTTTVALILAFFVVWWAYDTHRAEPKPAEAPQVVPPGYIPDPNYTWVPRSRLEQPPVTITETMTPPTVTETIAPTPHHSEPVPPPFQLPPPLQLPPPFGPPPEPPPGTPEIAPRGAPPGPPTTPSPAR